MLPQARAGPHFQASIISGKFHGMIWPDHADRLPQGVGKEIAADRDRLAFDLVGPAGVVAKAVDDALHVAARIADGLAAVERFEDGHVLGIFLDQVGEAEEQPAAVGGVHRGPRAFLQGLARGLDGPVNVFLAALGHLADGLAGCRVDGGESLVRSAIDELAVDEQRLVFHLGCLDGFALVRGGGTHEILR